MKTPTEHWEYRLKSTAQGLPYPPTPDIAPAIQLKVAEASRGSARHELAVKRWRFALVTISIVLVLLVGLLSVPGVRAAVLEFLQIGRIRIILPVPTQTPTPTMSIATQPVHTSTRLPPPSTPTPTPGDLITLADLKGETTLEEAIQKARFTLRLPTYPANLGMPDRVFVQDLGGAMAVLVWTASDNPDEAELIIYQIAPESWAGEKSQPSLLERTQVNGRAAVWAEGPYILYLKDGDLELRRLIAGKTLIWEENGVTYRLESHLSLSQAIKIAESLQLIP